MGYMEPIPSSGLVPKPPCWRHISGLDVLTALCSIAFSQSVFAPPENQRPCLMTGQSISDCREPGLLGQKMGLPSGCPGASIAAGSSQCSAADLWDILQHGQGAM